MVSHPAKGFRGKSNQEIQWGHKGWVSEEPAISARKGSLEIIGYSELRA